MKLYELFTDENENKTIIVLNNKGQEISRYDGKNSIDETYNDCTIKSIKEKGDIITATVIEYGYKDYVMRYANLIYDIADNNNHGELLNELSRITYFCEHGEIDLITAMEQLTAIARLAQA